jgi:hypothetical protein
MMEVIHYFKTSVLTRNTRCHISGGGILPSSRRGNLKSFEVTKALSVNLTIPEQKYLNIIILFVFALCLVNLRVVSSQISMLKLCYCKGSYEPPRHELKE